MTDYKLVPVELLKDWHERINTITAEMAFNVADEMEATLATAPAVQGKPMIWVYSHIEGTEVQTSEERWTGKAWKPYWKETLLYAVPQPTEQQPDVTQLVEALEQIRAIEDELYGGDWDEIEKARNIANEALAAHRKGGEK